MVNRLNRNAWHDMLTHYVAMNEHFQKSTGHGYLLNNCSVHHLGDIKNLLLFREFFDAVCQHQ